jgi:hypothetical protein
MISSYCPTSRTFYRLRSVLMHELDLHRHDVRPALALEELIPPDRRRHLWRRLRREGLALPSLRVRRHLRWAIMAHVLHAAIEAVAWCQNVLGFLVAVPLGLIAYLTTRRWAVHVNHCGPVTIRDAVYYLTDFREHYRACYQSGSLREAIRAGYRPSRKEIEMRVRQILAENLGIPLWRITPETRFDEELFA